MKGGHQVVVLKVRLPAGSEPALEAFLRDWTPQDARDPRAGWSHDRARGGLRPLPGLAAAEVSLWIERRWLRAEAAPGGGWLLTEVDVARLTLLVELRITLELDEEAMPLVLSLLDQLYDARRALRSLTAAIEAQPEPVRRAVLDAARRHARDVGRLIPSLTRRLMSPPSRRAAPVHDDAGPATLRPQAPRCCTRMVRPAGGRWCSCPSRLPCSARPSAHAPAPGRRALS